MKIKILRWAGIATIMLFGSSVGGAVWMAWRADASRNSSGTMAGINGPYVSGTTISSSVINARLADIETELTDSKSRSGKGDFSAAVRGADGTVAAPTWSWTSETGSGLYRIGASDIGFAIAGTKKLELTTALFTVTPAASFSSTLAVTSDFAINTNKFNVTASNGNTSVAGTLGVTGVTTLSSSASVAGALSVTNSTGVPAAGGSSAIYITGGYVSPIAGKIIVGDGTGWRLDFAKRTGSADTILASIHDQTGLTIGASGTATAQMNFGNCTLNGATPSTCTATVGSGAKCVATYVGTATIGTGIETNVVATTLTVTGGNTLTNVVNYVCF